jgi:hypothetical protein
MVVELPILVLLALLAWLLTLAVRILLLLSGFLPAALLLTRLLPGVLVLLAGILVRIGHRDLPFSKSQRDNCGTCLWLRETWVPGLFPLVWPTVVPALASRGAKN